MTTITTPKTFHPFAGLSFELRTRIWELSVEQRIVDERVVSHRPATHSKECEFEWGSMVEHLRSSTAAPAQLQTCRDAREYLTTHPLARYLYSKAFTEIAASSYDKSNIDPTPDDNAERERYVWLNYDLDIINIGKRNTNTLATVADKIYRLRLERDLGDEYFARSEEDGICKLFCNLRKIYLVSLYYSIREGYRRTEDGFIHLAPENVYFLDPEPGGLMINSVELDAMMTKEYLSRNSVEDLEGVISTEL